MKNLWMAAGFFFCSVALISCDTGTQEENTIANVDTELNATAAEDSNLDEDKREFMGYAYNNSLMQVELGQLAVEKGLTPQVREYGQQMVDLYGKRQQELQDMASQYNVTLPQNMTDDQMGRVQELRDKDVKDFDIAYWDTVVDAHKEALGEFDDNVKDIEETDNTTFSLWARNAAKEVRAHMEQAMKYRADLRN